MRLLIIRTVYRILKWLITTVEGFALNGTITLTGPKDTFVGIGELLRFSHKYNKMPFGFESSKLLGVLPVRLEDLSPEFLRYDTSYLDGGEEKQCKLPKSGNCMILLFQVCGRPDALWTTIRIQWPPEKLEYYRSHIGEVFECKITEK